MSMGGGVICVWVEVLYEYRWRCDMSMGGGVMSMSGGVI